MKELDIIRKLEQGIGPKSEPKSGLSFLSFLEEASSAYINGEHVSGEDLDALNEPNPGFMNAKVNDEIAKTFGGGREDVERTLNPDRRSDAEHKQALDTLTKQIRSKQARELLSRGAKGEDVVAELEAFMKDNDITDITELMKFANGTVMESRGKKVLSWDVDILTESGIPRIW